MRLGKAVASIVFGAWTLLVFFTSVSPDEAGARTSAWLNLPLIRSVPGWFLALAGSRWTLMLTALAVGALLGWWLRGRSDADPRINEWRALGQRATSLGYALDNSSAFGISNAVISEYNLIVGRMSNAGIAVPPGGIIDKNQASFFFHNVGRFLQEQSPDVAKQLAAKIIADWRTPDVSPVLFS